MRKIITFIALTAIAGTTLAHSSATGVVKERMDVMSGIGKATKTLGQMTKTGVIDIEKLRVATAIIAHSAHAIPETFKTRDLSKPSEALPAVWDNWDDFTAKAEALETAAIALAAAGTDPATFKSGFGRLGAACQACHRDYRQPQ